MTPLNFFSMYTYAMGCPNNIVFFTLEVWWRAIPTPNYFSDFDVSYLIMIICSIGVRRKKSRRGGHNFFLGK